MTAVLLRKHSKWSLFAFIEAELYNFILSNFLIISQNQCSMKNIRTACWSQWYYCRNIIISCSSSAGVTTKIWFCRLKQSEVLNVWFSERGVMTCIWNVRLCNNILCLSLNYFYWTTLSFVGLCKNNCHSTLLANASTEENPVSLHVWLLFQWVEVNKELLSEVDKKAFVSSNRFIKD